MSVYPFVFGLYPVLAMYAGNIDQLTLETLVPPSLLALGLAGAALAALRWPCGSFRRAAIPAALFIVLFFTYGHIRQLFTAHRATHLLLIHGLLMGLTFAAVATAALLVRERTRAGSREGTRARYRAATKILNTVSIALLAMPAARILAYELRAPRRGDVVFESAAAPAPGDDGGVMPNILFLVPDRYPSRSTLLEIYDFDNSGFLDGLRDRGFYVAEESLCNYGRTDLSLAATLNMSYLDDLLASTDERYLRRALYWAIQDSEVVSFLKARGYRYLHFGTWWHGTSRGRRADKNYNRFLIPGFGTMLYGTTLFSPIGSVLGFTSDREQWERETYKFDRLETLDTVSEPVFAFAHFLLPHEPYVFDRRGGFVGRHEQFRRGVYKGFVGQVEYVNRRVLALADRLAAASRPWVIVVQADEGPHPPHNFEETDRLQTLEAKFRILNALYLPGKDSGKLYADISPVNTFRLLFNLYFDTDYELLPDVSYLLRNTEPLDVTETVSY